jgi:hypothetical protein
MPRTHRDPQNLEKLSGRLLYFPKLTDGTFSAHGQDLGDIVMHKRQTESESVEAKFHPPTAVALNVREDVTSIKTSWTITGHEIFRETLAILLFGEHVGAANQASAVTQSVTFNTVVPRSVYKIGKFSVSAVTVEVSAAAKIVGTRDAEGVITPANADVVLDAALGTIEILESGTIAAGANVDVDFNCAAVTKRAYTAATSPKREGRFELYEFDGKVTPFRRANYFNGDIIARDQGEQNVEGDFNQYEFTIAVQGDWNAEEVE